MTQYDATSFHPELTIRRRPTQHFARRMACIVSDMTSPEAAAVETFKEVAEIMRYHGQDSYWRSIKHQLWAALKHRREAYQPVMDEVLEGLGAVLNGAITKAGRCLNRKSGLTCAGGTCIKAIFDIPYLNPFT